MIERLATRRRQTAPAADLAPGRVRHERTDSRLSVLDGGWLPCCRRRVPTVGPDYERPPVETPGAFRGDDDGGRPRQTRVRRRRHRRSPTQQWTDAVRRRGAARADRRGAGAELRRADRRQRASCRPQAQLGITRSNQFPTVNAQGVGAGAAHVRSGGTTARRAPAASLQARRRLAWELDFWGKYRRATEAARAQILASEWGRRAVVTSLVGDVASGYFALRALDLRARHRHAHARASARGVAAPDAGARERRRDVARRRATGRAARVRRAHGHRRSAAPHRAAGELPERAARPQSRPDRAWPRR